MNANSDFSFEATEMHAGAAEYDARRDVMQDDGAEAYADALREFSEDTRGE